MLSGVDDLIYPLWMKERICLGENEREEHILWKEPEPSLKGSSSYLLFLPAHFKGYSAGNMLIFLCSFQVI